MVSAGCPSDEVPFAAPELCTSIDMVTAFAIPRAIPSLQTIHVAEAHPTKEVQSRLCRPIRRCRRPSMSFYKRAIGFVQRMTDCWNKSRLFWKGAPMALRSGNRVPSGAILVPF
jgi:hypothetical protein